MSVILVKAGYPEYPTPEGRVGYRGKWRYLLAIKRSVQRGDQPWPLTIIRRQDDRDAMSFHASRLPRRSPLLHDRHIWLIDTSGEAPTVCAAPHHCEHAQP